MRSFEQTAAAFHHASAAAGVSYAFVGGLAVNAWGIPRNTADIDVLVQLEEGQIAGFTEALHSRRLAVAEEDFHAAFMDRAHVTVFDDEGAIHLDLKLVRAPEEIEQIKAAVELSVGGGVLRIARPEDTVAFKVRFGTPQDLADARGILARQAGRLDEARLANLASRLGVTGEVRRLQREAAASR